MTKIDHKINCKERFWKPVLEQVSIMRESILSGDEDYHDVYHNTSTHIDPQICGKTPMIIASIRKQLREYFNEVSGEHDEEGLSFDPNEQTGKPLAQVIDDYLESRKVDKNNNMYRYLQLELKSFACYMQQGE